MIPVQTLLKFPGQFFMSIVPTLLHATFPCTEEEYLAYNTKNGTYHFFFDGKEHKSDSIEELIEIAIREIEKAISFKISSSHDQCPYITLPLSCDEDGPAIDFYDAFTVLERPYRIEFYTDTFRRGVSRLRQLRA
jgi:hypothetical protein